MERDHIVAIDVGSVKICTLIAKVEDEHSNRIIGVGIEPSAGIRKGTVIDMKSASNAIARSVRKAERVAGIQINTANVSVAGADISSFVNKATVGIVGGVVDKYDISRVQEAVKAVPVPHDRKVLQSIQRSYSVDCRDGVKDPLGMHCSRLDAEAHVITASTAVVENLRQCVMTAEVDVSQFILSSLAAASAVLTDIEKNMGVVICDYGGGSVSMALFMNGEVWHSCVIPVGGTHITSDISQAFHLPADEAETVKLKHGSATPEYVDDDEFFYCRTFGKDEAAHLSRKKLAEVINARVEETFELVYEEIKRSGFDDLLPAGMVLTGGTALLPGIEKIAAKVMKMPVRIAKPEGLQGMVDQLDSPEYSTAVGLLNYSVMMQDAEEEPVETKKKFSQKVFDWFRQNLLP